MCGGEGGIMGLGTEPQQIHNRSTTDPPQIHNRSTTTYLKCGGEGGIMGPGTDPHRKEVDKNIGGTLLQLRE